MSPTVVLVDARHAFYLAMDVSRDGTDLLMVKKNVRTFNDAKSYVRFSDVQRIFEGFTACLNELQAHLISLLVRAA